MLGQKQKKSRRKEGYQDSVLFSVSKYFRITLSICICFIISKQFGVQDLIIFTYNKSLQLSFCNFLLAREKAQRSYVFCSRNLSQLTVNSTGNQNLFSDPGFSIHHAIISELFEGRYYFFLLVPGIVPSTQLVLNKCFYECEIT